MTPDLWLRVKAVVQEALERAPEARGAFVAEACHDDHPLRGEVESLLAAYARAGTFIDAPLSPAAAARIVSELERSAHKLQRGDRLGQYEVGDALGSGGMGEVYRARDTKLRREVAIKVLPPSVAHDPERLRRFEREAHLLASLNHPHIAAIYGFEESSGITALVLELVEGLTLAERIAARAVPIEEALPIARQIAEALEAAHERGIIHRDLKPANVKLTPDGTVKVLDFGLAKAEVSAGNVNESPTMTAMATREGVILGTAPYMSPEQARGKEVDKRADIWAFGCVLYELLTGARAFPGETTTDVLAAVVNRQPDFHALPAATPPSIRRLLARCLDKDPRRRLRDIGEARVEIDDALASPDADASPPAQSPSRPIEPRTIVLALSAVAVLTALVTWALTTMLSSPPQSSAASVRFAIVPPPAHPLNTSDLNRDIAISPDGQHLVFRAGGSAAGGPLMVRAIDRLDAQPLAGVNNARQPFFSPDNHWVGFLDGLELKKVLLTGGRAITICRLDAPNPRGASWSDDGTIVFATNDLATGLLRVSASGGEPTVLTRPDSAQDEQDHLFPSVLPGGRGVLFTVTAAKGADARLAVLDLETGTRTTLVRGASQAEYIVDPSTSSRQAGHLIYSVAGTLRAVRFDLPRLEVLGDPIPVVEDVMVGSTGVANYAVSHTGRLVYVPSEMGSQRSLVWVDRKGHETSVDAPARAYNVARVSPDGTRVVVEIRDQDNDLWIWDLVRPMLQRLTSDPSVDQQPIWTPDGRHVIFASERAGVSALYRQAADGTGAVERLTTSVNPQFPNSIVPDGTAVVGYENRPKTAFDLVLFQLGSAPTARVETLVKTTVTDLNAEVSPDGRYLAYQSNESGLFEIYVRPFPRIDGGRWQISTGGGTMPVWARAGRELFYLDVAGRLTAVVVQTFGTFNRGNPARILNTSYAVPVLARPYDVSQDGQRFLMIKDSLAGDPNATPASMIVVDHWVEELKRRVPTK